MPPPPYIGGTITVKGKLFGSTLGLMLSTNSSLSRMSTPVLTMADFNTERYGVYLLDSTRSSRTTTSMSRCPSLSTSQRFGHCCLISLCFLST